MSGFGIFRTLWARLRGLEIVCVEGDSMEPSLSSGQYLLVRRFNQNRFPQAKRNLTVGDLVLVERQAQPGIEYVKRIHEIAGSPPEFFLLSDNPRGNDSRKWGLLREDEIIGYIVKKVS